MTGATQMMKAMHKISLSFTSESQRIAVMKRKGKEKKTPRFLLSSSIHKEIERQDCTRSVCISSSEIFRKEGREKPAHSLLTASSRIFKVSMKPELSHLPAGIWTWSETIIILETFEISDVVLGKQSWVCAADQEH